SARLRPRSGACASSSCQLRALGNGPLQSGPLQSGALQSGAHQSGRDAHRPSRCRRACRPGVAPGCRLLSWSRRYRRAGGYLPALRCLGVRRSSSRTGRALTTTSGSDAHGRRRLAWAPERPLLRASVVRLAVVVASGLAALVAALRATVGGRACLERGKATDTPCFEGLVDVVDLVEVQRLGQVRRDVFHVGRVLERIDDVLDTGSF